MSSPSTFNHPVTINPGLIKSKAWKDLGAAITIEYMLMKAETNSGMLEYV